MIVMHAELPIDSEKKEAAIELLSELATESRAEDGVIDYRVTTDVEYPNVVRIFEQYEDEMAVDQHMESDHFQSFQQEIGSYMAGEASLVRFTVDDATDVM